MFRDEETLYHSVLIWHRSELFYTECKPGLSLAEGRGGQGRGGQGRAGEGRGGKGSTQPPENPPVLSARGE